MAAAQRIVQSLNAPKNEREDMISIFSSFDNRLSNITDFMSTRKDRAAGGNDHESESDARFEAAEKVILRWDSTGDSSHHSLPWEDSPDEAAELEVREREKWNRDRELEDNHVIANY